MFENILKILSKTPYWIFLVFGYLIYLGIKSTKKRIVSITKLSIISVVFLIFSIKHLNFLWDISDFIAYIWLGTILIGIFFGWISFVGKEVIVDKKRGLVQIPGSYNVLFIVMFVFISRYIIGFISAITLDLTIEPYMIFLKVFVSSLPAGILLGRLLFIFKNHTYGPFKELYKIKEEL